MIGKAAGKEMVYNAVELHLVLKICVMKFPIRLPIFG